MFKIDEDCMPCCAEELRAALGTYTAQLEAHKTTIGVPAPWPQYEVLRSIVASGGEFEVVPPPPPSPRERALKALAEKMAIQVRAAQDEMLVVEARKPDAPQELKDFIEQNPELVAEVDARLEARRLAALALGSQSS